MKVNRLLLLAMVTVVIVMSWRLYQQRHADTGQLTVLDRNGIVILAWTGRVDVPMHTLMARAFNERRDKSSRFVLQLNSPGGSLREGRAVIELLQDIRQTHRLDTYVARNHICMSMCVPMFLQGENRIAAPNARFMFHEPKRYHDDGSEAKGFSFEREALSRRFFERYFVDSPMDAGWRNRLEQNWVGKDVFKSARQLVDERSNIVTNLR